MLRFSFVLVFACLGLAQSPSASDSRTLVPPIQGVYLGWQAEAVSNPIGGNFNGALGWREKLYPASNRWWDYNFIGMEFNGNIRPHELASGARFVLQPTGFLQLSVGYHRIAYPWGLISLQSAGTHEEGEIFEEWDWGDSRWADRFTGSASLRKEWGQIQGKFQVDWSRLDVDDKRDSLYIPSDDIIVRSRDDIFRGEGFLGYRILTPFLSAWGVAYTQNHSMDHAVDRRRGGVWVQAWPFSSRQESHLRYWNVRGRIDLWLEHSMRQYEPRVELSLGWERNLLSALP